MAVLTREQVLQANDLKTEEVPVPEWNGSVLVKTLTGKQRDEYEATIVSMRGSDAKINLVNVRSKLVVWSVVDEQGQALFSPADVTALGAKSAAALQRVFDAAARLSGISKDDIEELSKNSASGQSDDSGLS